MAYSKIGINRISSWITGSSVQYEACLSYDLRKPATLLISDETVEDYRGRKLPLYTKFNLKFDSYNMGRTGLPSIYHLLPMAVADNDKPLCLEVVTQGGSSTTYDGVYQFLNTNNLGVDFTYTFSDKERMVSMEFNGKMEKDVANALITAAKTNTPINHAARNITATGSFRQDQWQTPYLEFVKYDPSGATGETVIVSQQDIISRNFTVKTTGRKTLYDKSINDYFDVNLELVIADASATKIETWHNMTTDVDFAPKIILKEKNYDGGSETHTFEAGTLTLTSETTIADDKRQLKLVFNGKIPTSNVVFAGTYVVESAYNYTITYSL